MTKNLTTFREVEIKDAPFLILLMEQLGYPIDKHTMEENIRKYTASPHQKSWVAENSTQVVGCIAVAITDFFHLPGSFLRVIAIVVDQNLRRSGLGKTLMTMAEQFALENNCSHIELTSGIHRSKLGFHEFYRSLGYTELNDTKKYFFKKITD